VQPGSQLRAAYRFGPFEIDSAERLLRRDGTVIALTPKAVDTLIALVEGAGRLVTKDELMTRLWPATFVEDANLSNQISLLRKALGDDSADPAYIETIPKRGYRFVAAVAVIGDDAGARQDAATAPGELRTDRPRRGRRGIAIAAGAAGVLLAGALWSWSSLRSKTSDAAVPLKIVRLTTSGQVRHASISADGNYVAYVALGPGGQRLVVRHATSTSEVDVVAATPANYVGLTFSPDGTAIYYVVRETDRPREGSLYRVSVLGGAPLPRRLLTDIDTPVSFSPDGKRIAYVVSNELTGYSAVMIADADGTGARALATRTRPNEFSWVRAGPAWVPDGTAILSAAVSADGRGRFQSVVEIRATDGSQTTFASPRFSEVGRIGWLANGRAFIVAAAERVGEHQLWQVAYPGGEAKPLTNDASKNYLGVGLSADGRVVATVQRDPQSTIWLWEKGGDSRVRQVSGGKYDGRFGLAWTTDRRIVYHSLASGNEDIWSMNADGSARRQLTVDPGVDESPAVSPDGRHIVFVSNRAGDFNVWRMGVNGDNAVQLTHGNGDATPAVTPDGQWVIYASSTTGKPRLWKVPLAGGEPAQLTDDYATTPAISPDGTQVAFRFRDDPATDGMLAILRFPDGRRVKVFDAPFGEPHRLQWTADGITYVAGSAGAANIWSQPPDGGPPRQVTDLGSGTLVRYEWSLDGKSLVFARGTMNNDVVLISNLGR